MPEGLACRLKNPYEPSIYYRFSVPYPPATAAPRLQPSTA
jgi:hypothetical protein